MRWKIIPWLCVPVLAFTVQALPVPPVNAAEPATAHPPGCSDFAGAVSRELMERPAPLAPTPGNLHQKVSTQDAQAQAYYDQGIAWLASYVWVEAARSFHEALRRDPGLGMLDAQMALHGKRADEGGKALLKIADELAANPRFDAWGEGLFRLERAAAEAARAGHADLAAQIAERMLKIDPEYRSAAMAPVQSDGHGAARN